MYIIMNKKDYIYIIIFLKIRISLPSKLPNYLSKLICYISDTKLSECSQILRIWMKTPKIGGPLRPEFQCCL